MQARSIALKALAAQLKISDPPEVQLVRFVDSTEWPQAQIACLTAAGYNVSLTSDGGGIDLSKIPANLTAPGGSFMLARYTCEAQYSSKSDGSTGFSDAQLSALYDIYVKIQVPCLEAHGITVSTPPSRQTFIATYNSDDLWIPWASVPSMSVIGEKAWADLNQACPQEIDTSKLGN